MNLSGFPLLSSVGARNCAQTSISVANTQPVSIFLGQNNDLTSAQVDATLVALDGNGLLNGTVDLSGQTPLAPPTGTGRTAAASLIGKGWTVTLDEIAWAPATEAVTWIDTNGTFTNNLAAFLASADFDTVSSMVFGATGLLTSLTGLQALTALATLDCNTNALTSLDLSNCSALTTLNCSQNALLTTLTLTGCTALVALDCNGCNITGTLNLGLFTSLDHVYCYNNPNLTTLDIHGCTAIKDALAAGCGITTFNAANVITIDSIDLTGNPLVTLSLPDMTSLMLTLTLVNMPNFTGIVAPFMVLNDNLQIVNCPSLITFTESNTAAMGGTFGVQSCPNLTSITTSLLATTNQDIFINGNTSLTSVVFTVGFGSGAMFSMSGCTSLVSFSTNYLGAPNDQDMSGCTSLTTFNCPLWGMGDGSTVSFNGDALNSSSIDLILSRAVASGITTGTIDLSGGSNLSHASWSVAALADETTLTTAGVTVLSNP